MKKRGLADFFFLLLMGYLLLPVLATMLYAFATKWNKTILPEGLTLKWLSALFQDTDFMQAFGRSVFLAGGQLVLHSLSLCQLFSSSSYTFQDMKNGYRWQW